MYPKVTKAGFRRVQCQDEGVRSWEAGIHWWELSMTIPMTESMTESSRPTKRGNFSVVVPYFNEARFLAATLESLMNQTRLPDQLILVDNGSTDGSTDVCKRVLRCSPVRRVLFLNEPRRGRVHALKAAEPHIDGEFTAFADPDALYPDHYLEMAEGLFRSSGGADVVLALHLLGEPGDPFVDAYRFIASGVARLFPSRFSPRGGGRIYRTATLFRAGGLPDRPGHGSQPEEDLLLRVLRLGKAFHHPDFWCRCAYRRGDRNDAPAGPLLSWG